MIELNQPFQLFSEEQCKDIISRASKEEIIWGTTYTNKKNVRNNQIVWLPLSAKEYDDLWNLVEPFWGTVHWYEKPVQISRYTPGQFYDWHGDQKPNHRRSSVRHFTLTCTLQIAPDALFETRLGSYDLQTGQAILFPSELEHRACAPSSGERWSLTVWYMRKKHEATTT